MAGRDHALLIDSSSKQQGSFQTLKATKPAPHPPRTPSAPLQRWSKEHEAGSLPKQSRFSLRQSTTTFSSQVATLLIQMTSPSFEKGPLSINTNHLALWEHNKPLCLIRTTKKQEPKKKQIDPSTSRLPLKTSSSTDNGSASPAGCRTPDA